MDCVLNKLKIVFLPFLALFLVACETHVDEEPLQVIGAPARTLYYDTSFEYDFGASGGDGLYRFRYIQNPESEETALLADNVVEMTVEAVEGAKPFAWFRAVPRVPDGIDFEAITAQKYRYAVEVTDGKNEVVEEFEFTLDKNSVLLDSDFNGTEGVPTNVPRFIQSYNERFPELLCEAAKGNEDTNKNYQVRELPDGRKAYPLVYDMVLDEPAVDQVSFTYGLSSAYDPSRSELDSRNIGYARPDVDYVDVERTIVLEAGETTCIVVVEVLDDAQVEGVEELTIEFRSRTGAHVDFTQARATLTIRDNEPVLDFDSANKVVNEGGSFSSQVKLSFPSTVPVDASLVIDPSSTVSESSYEIVPDDGVIRFEPGEVEKTFTINFADDVDVSGATGDGELIVDVDVKHVYDLESVKLRVNEWASSPATLAEELVAASSDSETAVSLSVDEDHNTLVLVQDDSGATSMASLKRYTSSGGEFNLLDSGQAVLSKVGLNVEPVAVESSEGRVVVLAMVDGPFNAVHRGGKDLVVAVYNKKDNGNYDDPVVKQYGSEGDDIVNGAQFDNNGNLYVWGRTSGTQFDGVPSESGNKGGQDGFVYKILPGEIVVDGGGVDSNLSSVDWVRFVGTEDDDEIVAIDALSREIVAVGETSTTDKDGFVSTFSSTQVSEGAITNTVIRKGGEDNYTSVRYDDNARSFYVLSDTEFESGSITPTPSLTRDVVILNFSGGGDQGFGQGYISSPGEDFAKDMLITTNNENFIVTGETTGVFENNVGKGGTGRDAFVATNSIIEGYSANFDVSQFGTDGNDQIIDLQEVGDYKLVVLWGEDSSSGDGSIRYRVSPFTFEGEKLSVDP